MEEFADRHERQPVVHSVFDDGSFTTIVKSVGLSPESVGTTHLLVYEPDRWLPMRDTRLPAQPNPEQAEPTAGCGDIDTCRTPCICERLSTPSTEGHAPIMLRGSTTLKTAV